MLNNLRNWWKEQGLEGFTGGKISNPVKLDEFLAEFNLRVIEEYTSSNEYGQEDLFLESPNYTITAEIDGNNLITHAYDLEEVEKEEL